MCYLLTNSLKSLLISIILILLFKFIQSSIGFFSIPLACICYLEGVIIRLYLNAHYIEQEAANLNFYYKISNFSLILSVVFIIIVYYESELVRIYNLILQRIFYVKIISDFALISSFIYNVYIESMINSLSNDNEKSIYNMNYVFLIINSYKIIAMIFLLHYGIIYFSLFAKLNFIIQEQTIDLYFPLYIEEENKNDKNNKNNKNFSISNNKYPYFEVKFTKV